MNQISEILELFFENFSFCIQRFLQIFPKSDISTFSLTKTGNFCEVMLTDRIKCNSSVIRQKGESQNGCFKNTKHAKFSEKHISNPLIRTRTCAYQGVRNVRFLENLACFVFLKQPFWDSPFRLITDELSTHKN